MNTIQITKFQRYARAVIAFTLFLVLLAGCSAAAPAATIAQDDPLTNQAAKSSASFVPLPAADALPPVSPAVALPRGDDFAILFVNVGKGDASILRFGATTVLIDTGSPTSAPQLIAALNALHVSVIDGVFLTHSHSDHLGGLDALAANYDIPIVYSPLYSEADKSGLGKIIKRAEKLGLTHQELKAGDRVPITNDISFNVLGPLEFNRKDDNDNSLVLRFSYGGKTFLFAGDMQFSEEQTLIDAGADLKSDVLKIGNHGNPDATGEDFASLVSPTFAVISTSTVEDADSANDRIYAALPNAEVYITQDFALGVLMTLDESGALRISNPMQDETAPDVSIRSIDVDRQAVTLVNNGSVNADLSGCILFSASTETLLRFPENTILAPEATATIGSGGDFVFPNEDKPLSKKKANTVTLYGNLGTVISELAE